MTQSLLFLVTVFWTSLVLVLQVDNPLPREAQVQEFSGNLEPQEVFVYYLKDLPAGANFYAYAKGVSGNLDPFLGLVPAQTDLAQLEIKLETDIDSEINAGKSRWKAASEAASKYLLAWNDDLQPGHQAGLQVQVPADGDYLLFVRSSPNWVTFGNYLLLLGLEEPQILDGKAKPVGEPFAYLDQNLSSKRANVQEITGSLESANPLTYFTLGKFVPGDRFYAYVEATTGDLKPILQLIDFSGKPLSDGNRIGGNSAASIEYSFDAHSPPTRIVISGDGAGEFRLLAGRNIPEVLQGGSLSSISGQTGTLADLDSSPVLRQPIPVQIGLKLQQITQVDQKNEFFEAQVALRMEWTDTDLAFNPDQCQCSFKTFYGDSFRDYLQGQDLLWPDFTIYNQQLNRWSQTKMVTLTPGGRAIYLERFTTRFQAPDFNFRKFPFDRQDFFIRVDSNLPDEFFRFENDPSFTELGSQLGEEEWVFDTFDTQVSNQAISTLEPVSRYSFHVSVRRYQTYYITRFFIPLGLLVLVSWAIFFMRDYLKRVEVAMSNLLLFIAWNFSIGGDLPRLGYVTLMDTLLVGTFFITTLVVIYNVFLLYLKTNQKTKRAEKIDEVMTKIYPFTYLGATLVICAFFLI
jgi:hypothetical protein